MPLILGTNSIKDTGYNVDNSLRFNSGSSDFLNRTTETPTNADKATFSFWVKRSKLGTNQSMLSERADGNNLTDIYFNSDDKLEIYSYNSGTEYIFLRTVRLFRDVGAWMHIMYSFDTSQGTNTNRVKLYINGVQETSFSSGSGNVYPNQNQNLRFNESGHTLRIGNLNSDQYPDFYLSEVVFVDGTAQANTDLGEFDEDSGIWKPIDVSGLTFGNNGFYLDFENSGSLGADVSGNGNNFTVNNLTAVDQSTDTCTNNFATLNPLYPTGGGFDIQASATFEEGNTKFTTSNGDADWGTCVSSIAVSSGKWYVEMKKISGSEGVIGIRANNSDNDNAYIGRLTHGVCYQQSGHKRVASTQSTYGDTWTTNDIIGVALDLDNNKLYFSKNGVWQNSGDPTSGATGTGAISIDAASSTVLGVYYIGATEVNSSGNGTFSFNFGNPSFTISSGNTDGNGYGNFEYAVPSGYYSLNTKNLAEYG